MMRFRYGSIRSAMVLVISSAGISSNSTVRAGGRKLLPFSQHAKLSSPSRHVHGSSGKKPASSNDMQHRRLLDPCAAMDEGVLHWHSYLFF